jgi:AraC family carnitine catabolism transcriptional activator
MVSVVGPMTMKRPSALPIEDDGIDVVAVSLLLLPGFSIGEFSQLADVFSAANRKQGFERFCWTSFGLEEGRVESSSGIAIPCRLCTDLRRPNQKLIIIGPRPRDAGHWATLSSVVRFCRRHNGFIAGIGDAVEVLAELGLLNGKKASAHWEMREVLRELQPEVDFGDFLFTADDAVGTCAGASATIDFALDFVGRFTSNAVVDRIVYSLKSEPRRRPEGLQRKAHLASFANAHSGFVAALKVMQNMDSKDFDLHRISTTAGVSTRQLQRLFSHYLKTTPTKFFRSAKLNHGRELLQRTTMSVTEVAIASGFESASLFSRHYAKAFGLTPTATRRCMAAPRGRRAADAGAQCFSSRTNT